MRKLRLTDSEVNALRSEYESISISCVPYNVYLKVLQYLRMKLEGAKWDRLPNDTTLKLVDDFPAGFFCWSSGDENTPANRTAYMEHLNRFPWPEGCELVNVASKNDLLSQRFADFSFTGTIDVALSATGNIRANVVGYNILLGITLKKPVECEVIYHNQVVMQHLCSSCQNPNTGVLTLLTDLNELWCFFWFGSPWSIFKCCANIMEAKFLLKNMFNSEVKDCCPEGFHSRLSWYDCFSSNERK